MVEQHQPQGPLRDDLAAQLGADGAARAADQHRLARDVAGEQPGLRRHRVAAQQVGHVEVADVGQAGRTVDHLGQAGENFHRQPGTFDPRDQSALALDAGGRNGDHDLFDIVAVDRILQRVGRVYLERRHRLGMQRRVVVEKTHRLVFEADLHRLRQLRTRRPGAVDGGAHPRPPRMAQAAAQHRAGDEARGDHVGEGDEPVGQQGRARQRQHVEHDRERQRRQHRRRQRQAGRHHHPQIDIAHHGAVQAGEAEHRQGRQADQELRHRRRLQRGLERAQAQCHRGQHAQGQEQRVDADHHRELGARRELGEVMTDRVVQHAAEVKVGR